MMKKAFWTIVLLLFAATGVHAQDVKQNIESDKLMAIRSNSRDIAPVRKTNLHKQHIHRKAIAINKSKRTQLRKKRMLMQKKRMLIKKKRIMQQKRMLRNRGLHNRRR